MSEAVMKSINACISKKGYSNYKSWFNKNVNRINKLTMDRMFTVWDRMERKSRKF